MMNNISNKIKKNKKIARAVYLEHKLFEFFRGSINQ